METAARGRKVLTGPHRHIRSWAHSSPAVVPALWNPPDAGDTTPEKQSHGRGSIAKPPGALDSES